MKLHKRIRKKLYRALKRAQADDVILSAPRIVEIRFYIKNDNRRAQRVTIANDFGPGDALVAPSFGVLPKFILSQLQAQKIADLSRASNQLLAALALASKCLARNPLQQPTYPTCFTWYNRETHRTHCVFGYILCQMESRVYSAAELLELRDVCSSQITPDMLAFNKDVCKYHIP